MSDIDGCMTYICLPWLDVCLLCVMPVPQKRNYFPLFPILNPKYSAPVPVPILFCDLHILLLPTNLFVWCPVGFLVNSPHYQLAPLPTGHTLRSTCLTFKVNLAHLQFQLPAPSNSTCPLSKVNTPKLNYKCLNLGLQPQTPIYHNDRFTQSYRFLSFI